MEHQTPISTDQVAVDSRSPVARAYVEVVLHLEKHGRTVKDEFELIQQKKSILSRRLRDFVTLMYEVELHSKEELPLDPNAPSPISE